MSNPRTVLVIDDQIGVVGSPHQRSFLRNYDDLPYTFVFESCSEGGNYNPQLAAKALRESPEVDLVLLDLNFGEDPNFGFNVLSLLTREFSGFPIVLMSSLDRDIDRLGRALEEGAMGFVEKHRSSAYLGRAIEAFISLRRSHALLGQSQPLRDLRRQAARLAPYDEVPILIVGERGTGKERVARYIWQSGKRSQGPFIAVNCGGIPPSLFEAEFFGSEKGAFTGSTALRKGYLERAHGGILFLDEVANLPMDMQAKLLRALQDKTYHRVGSEAEERQANVQIVSATNVSLEELISQGKVREDFYDRIAAFTVHTPPLRNCREDIPLLARHFITELVGGKKQISEDALVCLSEHSWPGNVRELQRVLQESAVRSEDRPLIEETDLPDKVFPKYSSPDVAIRQTGTEAISRPDHERILSELRMIASLKKQIRRTRRNQWRAELMRALYPHCKAANAKGLSDALKRLTQGPWGEPNWETFSAIRDLVVEIKGDID